MKFVLAVGLIILLVGLVMVLSSAFKHRFAWGVAMLLLPVVAPVYAVYKWSEHQARNGLFTLVVGLFIVAAAFYGGVGRDIAELSTEVPSKDVQQQVKKLVEKIPTAGPPDEPLPNQTEANKVQSQEGPDYDPIHGDDEFAFAKIDALPPDEDVRVIVPDQPEVEHEFQVITTAQVGKFNNRHLQITTKRGDLREGKLIRSEEDSLFLQSTVEGGVVQFQYEFEDIAAILVYEVKGVVSAMKAPMVEGNMPELGASTNHDVSSAGDANSIDQALPVQGDLRATAKAVPNTVRAKTPAQTAGSSLQPKQAGLPTMPETTTSVSSDPKNVSPKTKSGAKPVIYIKPKPSSSVESDKTAHQPELKAAQSSETSMVVPNPATSTDAPVVQ